MKNFIKIYRGLFFFLGLLFSSVYVIYATAENPLIWLIADYIFTCLLLVLIDVEKDKWR